MTYYAGRGIGLLFGYSAMFVFLFVRNPNSMCGTSYTPAEALPPICSCALPCELVFEWHRDFCATVVGGLSNASDVTIRGALVEPSAYGNYTGLEEYVRAATGGNVSCVPVPPSESLEW